MSTKSELLSRDNGLAALLVGMQNEMTGKLSDSLSSVADRFKTQHEMNDEIKI